MENLISVYSFVGIKFRSWACFSDYPSYRPWHGISRHISNRSWWPDPVDSFWATVSFQKVLFWPLSFPAYPARLPQWPNVLQQRLPMCPQIRHLPKESNPLFQAIPAVKTSIRQKLLDSSHLYIMWLLQFWADIWMLSAKLCLSTVKPIYNNALEVTWKCNFITTRKPSLHDKWGLICRWMLSQHKAIYLMCYVWKSYTWKMQVFHTWALLERHSVLKDVWWFAGLWRASATLSSPSP